MAGDKNYHELKSQIKDLEKKNKRFQNDHQELLLLRQTIEKAPFAIGMSDRSGNHFYHNKAFTELFGYNTSSFKSVSPRKLYSDPEIADHISNRIQNGRAWSGEVEMQKKSGELFYADVNARAIRGKNKQIIALVSIHQDVSEKKQSQKQDHFHSEYLQTLYVVTLGMMRRLDLSNLLNAIVVKACSLTQIPNGYVVLFNPLENEFEIKAGCGTYKQHIGLKLPVSEGLSGKVFDERQPLIIENYGQWEGRSRLKIFNDISGIVGVPLISGSVIHGVIGLSRSKTAEGIDAGFITILEEFSSIATIAIDNAKLYGDLQKEFQKRLEIEKESKVKERRANQAARKQNKELKEAYLDSIHRLVMASEFKDEDTGDHILRIGEYSRILAEKLGWSKKKVEHIHYAAPMHDVGKIGIPDKIMLKPGKLTRKEFETIKTHTEIGARLLSESKSEILKMAKEIAFCHHEKYNGTGYPRGLAGGKIPISARIVAIADTFDALTSKRPYKEAYPPEMALDIIRTEKGEHFDPLITDLFIEHFELFLKIREDIGTFEKIDLANFTVSERDREKFDDQRILAINN